MKNCDLSGSTQKEWENQMGEIRVQEVLKYHKNIVKLIDKKIEGRKFFLIQEFCNKGDLHQKLQEWLL